MPKITLQKTNIRIFNKYLIMKTKIINNKTNYDFYLTEISDPKDWFDKDNNQKTLEKIKGEKLTNKIEKLMDEYNIYSNVNFHLSELDGGNITPKVNVVKVGG